MLVGAVVVGAVGDGGRKSEGAGPGALCTLYQKCVEEGHIGFFRYPEYGGAEGSSLFKGM